VGGADRWFPYPGQRHHGGGTQGKIVGLDWLMGVLEGATLFTQDGPCDSGRTGLYRGTDLGRARLVRSKGNPEQGDRKGGLAGGKMAKLDINKLELGGIVRQYF